MHLADNIKERIVWLSLIALTMLSCWLGETRGEDTGYEMEIITTAIMLVGFFKVHLVGMHFMELGRAPWPLRLAFEAWIVIACAAILLVYWKALVT
jgi:hypothetical protein